MQEIQISMQQVQRGLSLLKHNYRTMYDLVWVANMKVSHLKSEPLKMQLFINDCLVHWVNIAHNASLFVKEFNTLVNDDCSMDSVMSYFAFLSQPECAIFFTRNLTQYYPTVNQLQPNKIFHYWTISKKPFKLKVIEKRKYT